MTSFYSLEELEALGFKKLGGDVLISRKASFYSVDSITFGSHVRIDDFCILSGKIEIGDYVHIAAYAAIFAPALVTIGDFCGLSSRVSVYSGTDSYIGDCLTNPTVPSQYRDVKTAEIGIGRFCTIGSGSVVLPGVIIGEGTNVGALSLVNTTLGTWSIYSGNPIRKLAKREHSRIIEYAKELKPQL